MRIVALAFAVVAVLEFRGNRIGVEAADDVGKNLGDAGNVMGKKAAETFVATPIKEAWKDVYEAVVRRSAPKVWRRIVYKVMKTLSRDDLVSLARHIMEKVKSEVFQDRINDRIWDRVCMEFYYYLRDWWTKTPENPVAAAELGVWQALTNLHLDVIGPTMRGSPRVAKLNAVILDRDLTEISSWVDEWRDSLGLTKEAQRAGS